MWNCQPLGITAGNLQATEESLMEFNREGWIELTVRNGCRFISGHDEP
jgi:hypothetical protein